MNQAIIDIPVEEVKAPDISDLLKDSWEGNIGNEVNDLQEITQSIDNVQNFNKTVLKIKYKVAKLITNYTNDLIFSY